MASATKMGSGTLDSKFIVIDENRNLNSLMSCEVFAGLRLLFIFRQRSVQVHL